MEDERREEIMWAVYTALCSRGYAELTMQDIADEASISKGALHYHFDTKRDLLLAFLEHLFGRFTDRLSAAEVTAGDDPIDRLIALVDAALSPPERDGEQEFRTAILEIKAQAPYVPAYRDRLTDFDAYVHDRVEAIVVEGIERGRYDDETDPADVASFVVTMIDGAHTRCVATDESVETVRRSLIDYLSGLSTDGDDGDDRDPEISDRTRHDGEADGADAGRIESVNDEESDEAAAETRDEEALTR